MRRSPVWSCGVPPRYLGVPHPSPAGELVVSHPSLSTILERTIAGEDLEASSTQSLLERVLSGEVDPHWLAGWLVALRMKGESTGEIAGLARAMRARVTRVPTRSISLVDTCGTGGDGSHSFNVSTASAFVAAGAGAHVAKHGNRSVSSTCGSADVLEALGGELALEPEQVGRCIDELGFGFLFAPALHGAMKHAAVARRALGVRTIFNVLGPLTNPAGAEHQVIGVYAPEWVGQVAAVMSELGASRSLVVHGREGLDELSVCGVSDAMLVEGGVMREIEVDPSALGIPTHPAGALRGGDARTNARILREVLGGVRDGAERDVVRLNAGAALWVSGLASDLTEGIERATESLDRRAALRVLDAWIALSRDLRTMGET